jgi:putative toxin-antitoxin system antitoxin component (TIGR02293 family)
MKKYRVLDNTEDPYFSSLNERSIYDVIQTVREGIPYYAFENYAARSPFTMADWSEFLGLSERSLQRYKKDKKSFNRLHSDRIIEIVRVLNKGVEVFGDEEKFAIWMNSKIIALGGIKPKELLDSSIGIKILDDELTRIDYGIFA